MERKPTSQRRRWQDAGSNVRTTRSGVLVCFVLTLASAFYPASAARLLDAHLTSVHDAYTIRTEVLLTGSPAEVRGALVEYRRLPALNPNIEAVIALPNAEDGRLRLRLHARACFLMICQRYQWVQKVNHLPDGQIFAIVEPADSDFDSGWFRYRFVPDGEKCRLILEARLSPKEGIATNRLVRAVMKQVLADEAVTLAKRLEKALVSESSKDHALVADAAG